MNDHSLLQPNLAPVTPRSRRRSRLRLTVLTVSVGCLPLMAWAQEKDVAQNHQPKELRVIDRATARKMAEDQQRLQSHPDRHHQNELESARRNRQWDDPSWVQPAAYQSPAPRVYQTPAPQMNPYDGPSPHSGPPLMPYGMSPGLQTGPPMGYAQDYPYGSGYGSGYGESLPIQPYNQPPQLDRGPVYPQATNEPYPSQPPYEMIDDRAGGPAPEHPFANPNYSMERARQESLGNANQNYAPQQPSRGQPPHYSNHVGSPQSRPDQRYHEPAHTWQGGQGYLQHGSMFQGSHLRGYPQTATEKALELQQENDQLKDAIERMESQLQTRVREIEETQVVLLQKDEELKAMMARTTELQNQVAQLTQERNAAVDERHTVERRCNEQLKGIESMLDGVLMNQLSNRDVAPK